MEASLGGITWRHHLETHFDAIKLATLKVTQQFHFGIKNNRKYYSPHNMADQKKKNFPAKKGTSLLMTTNFTSPLKSQCKVVYLYSYSKKKSYRPLSGQKSITDYFKKN